MNDIAKAILNNNKYAVLSTVREDGAPWATPVHIAHDDKNVYWLSNDDTIHSINLARDDRAFLTIFNSQQKSSDDVGDHGALYISTKVRRLSGIEADKARAIFELQHPQNKSSTLGDWSVFCSPIGVLNPAKTNDDRVYYQHVQEGTESTFLRKSS